MIQAAETNRYSALQRPAAICKIPDPITNRGALTNPGISARLFVTHAGGF